MAHYQRILIAVDDSDTSKIAAKHGLSLSSGLSASCAIVYVIDTDKVRDAAYAEVLPADLLVKLRNKARDTLDSISKEFPEHSFERFMPKDKPSHGIIKVAKDWQADLIVIGTLGKSGLKRVFLGSTAENTIRLSSIPILVIPAKT
jgi:nucleotide-binding universal stress UspA family protein